MKKLIVTDKAMERLQHYISPDKRVVLDFDDGGGRFPQLVTAT